MKRVEADVSNSMTSEPVGIVKLASPGSWQARRLPPLEDGERVLLRESGLEVEAIVYCDEDGWWLAKPVEGTWRDLPEEYDIPLEADS